MSANAWHHAAATFVSSTRQITLYLDGVQVAQGTVPASSAVGSPKPLSIGRNGTTGGNWNGKLDDIRIWNLVRTATQISTSYQSELTGSPIGLVANWKLNDASGSLATDVGVARSYTYNGDGLLKSRTEAGASTQVLWDVGVAPAKLLVLGSDRLVHGLSPLYIVRGDGTTRTLATDGLGSVRAELTDAATVSASFRYAVYGKPVTKPVMPTLLGYAGESGDSSGLIYLRARWYDPAVGRFITRDPLSGHPVAPLSLNSYGYAAAAPISRTDPSGLDPDGSRECLVDPEDCPRRPGRGDDPRLPIEPGAAFLNVAVAIVWSELQGRRAAEINPIVQSATDEEIQQLIGSLEQQGWKWEQRSGGRWALVSQITKGDQLLFEYANKYHPTDYVKFSVSSARPDIPGGRLVQEFRTARNWVGWFGGGGGTGLMSNK